MTLQTLVAAVDQTDHSLALQMNLQTDALVGNQGNVASTESFALNGHWVTYMNTTDRGVGKNRNLLLESASADLCILADDDMRFVDGYPEIVEEAVGRCPQGDVWIFNLIEKNPRRYVNRKIRPVRRWSYGKYGAARLVIRRQAVLEQGIRFSLSFGGGTRYGSGEDTIFLRDCLRHGLKLYAVPYALAEIDQTAESTWFRGYTPKFFRDKGALYACLHPVLWPAYTAYYLLRYRKKFRGSISCRQAAKNMLAGGNAFRTGSEETP